MHHTSVCWDAQGLKLGWCCGRQYWCSWAMSSTACLACCAYSLWHCVGILCGCTTICIFPPICPPWVFLCGLLWHLGLLGHIVVVPLLGFISCLWDGCTKRCRWFQLGVHTLLQWWGLDSTQKWYYLLRMLGRMPLFWGYCSHVLLVAHVFWWMVLFGSCHMTLFPPLWRLRMACFPFSSCVFKTSIMCVTTYYYLLSSWYTK